MGQTKEPNSEENAEQTIREISAIADMATMTEVQHLDDLAPLPRESLVSLVMTYPLRSILAFSFALSTALLFVVDPVAVMAKKVSQVDELVENEKLKPSKKSMERFAKQLPAIPVVKRTVKVNKPFKQQKQSSYGSSSKPVQPIKLKTRPAYIAKSKAPVPFVLNKKLSPASRDRMVTIKSVRYDKEDLEKCLDRCKIKFRTKSKQTFVGFVRDSHLISSLKVARGKIDVLGVVGSLAGSKVFLIKKIRIKSPLKSVHLLSQTR